MKTKLRSKSKIQPITSADPLWFKDAIIYQLHVRAFCDANGDGMGDFRGLTEKLDYIRDLGVTAIWVQPFFLSPQRDDGYDIADYTRINPAYGNMRDLKVFLKEAHARDLRIITELVMNHTSDQHEWFQKSRRAKPGEKWRDYYVWSDTDTKYADARIIFQDFEVSNWTWDPVANAYFWHRFYHHQPDLNFDNPEVHEAMLATVDFWFDLGVDGMRLDAVPYLYEREGTNCENLPETHAFLAKLRSHIDAKYPDKMLLAEANQWPEDAAAYFGGGARVGVGEEAGEVAIGGDECHMNFHFPLMPRLFMAIEREDRFPILDILAQTPEIPENCQWGIFLRNHDELTLEMVTDEERDYMYRTYADDPRARVNLGIRRRLAPLLRDNRRKIELMNALLLSLPGTPVLYYGDEIPMGDNIYLGDRDGVRTPMQWNNDRNAGFSRSNPQRLYLPVIIDEVYHFASRNVEVETARPESLLWWTRRIINLRKQHSAFGRGTMKFLTPTNPKVLAYLRQHGNETILVVANLSRFAQCAELDLAQFRGQQPVEMFGQTKFPPIGTLPYFLTLGGHAFYWFRLEWQAEESPALTQELPHCKLAGRWDGLFSGKCLTKLESALPAFLRRHRWFIDKTRQILRAKVLDVLAVQDVPKLTKEYQRPGRSDALGLPPTRILLVTVDYAEGESDIYVLPVVFATGEQQRNILGDHPGAGIMHLNRDSGEEGATLCDSTRESEFWLLLNDAFKRERTIAGRTGELQPLQLKHFARQQMEVKSANENSLLPEISIPVGEKRNAHAIVDGKTVWKLLRQTGAGENPDLELGRYLTEDARFTGTSQLSGAWEYVAADGDRFTLALLHEYVPNQGTAWQYTHDELKRYLERIESEQGNAPPPDALLPECSLLERAELEPPQAVYELMGPYLRTAQLLGQRTAELHFALAAGTSKTMAPEAFTKLYQRSIYQSMRVQLMKGFDQLKARLPELAPEMQPLAQKVLSRQADLYAFCQAVKDEKITAQRIRCHGDLHLGHMLFTGKDFVIVNFEGESNRPLGERRIKTTPLKDVASMIRSYHYVSQAATMHGLSGTAAPAVVSGKENLAAWLRVWYLWATAAYLKSYFAVAGTGKFLPTERESFSTLLNAYVMEKAIYELSFDLQHRPDWATIPLSGLLKLLPEE